LRPVRIEHSTHLFPQNAMETRSSIHSRDRSRIRGSAKIPEPAANLQQKNHRIRDFAMVKQEPFAALDLEVALPGCRGAQGLQQRAAAGS
jgi:hypothetical protein